MVFRPVYQESSENNAATHNQGMKKPKFPEIELESWIL